MSVYEITYIEQVIRGHSVRMIPRIERVQKTIEITSTDKTLGRDIAQKFADKRFELVSVHKIS